MPELNLLSLKISQEILQEHFKTGIWVYILTSDLRRNKIVTSNMNFYTHLRSQGLFYNWHLKACASSVPGSSQKFLLQLQAPKCLAGITALLHLSELANQHHSWSRFGCSRERVISSFLQGFPCDLATLSRDEKYHLRTDKSKTNFHYSGWKFRLENQAFCPKHNFRAVGTARTLPFNSRLTLCLCLPHLRLLSS